MTKVITLAEAQEDLLTLVKNVKYKGAEYIITVDGIPSAKLESFEKYKLNKAKVRS